MQTKGLVAALSLLALCFIGFAWWVYLSAGGKVHWAVPALATLLPIVTGLLLALIPRLSAKAGAAKLEHALASETSRDSRLSVRSPEIERLRGEFERAVGALKTSKLARGQGNARDALYRLPWYTIIGPPASGKTTVLRNSGLKFPHLSGTGDRLKGIGGTRNCDWWLTNHAVLLDTAGRWTLEDDDRAEWFAFLDLLKQHRGRQPLNGVIVAMSIAGDDETSLAGVDLEGVKLLAGRVRERLDEITGRLGVALPVYLMFTKCDLISGFVETFEAMSSLERRQIWGFTAPLLSTRSISPGAYFGEQFKGLKGALEQHAMSRMAQEVRPDITAKIFEFPAQFAALEEKLCAFVDELFEESAYGENPILRGGYFTSGTQEGAPADFLLGDMGRALNIRVSTAEREGSKKSYFLHDMLMRVVFEDRTLASASQEELRRQLKQQRIWTSGLFGFAALLACLPTLSCHNNLESLGRTRSVLAEAQQASAPGGNSVVPFKLEELAALDTEAVRYEAGLPSVNQSFGLYQGDDLKDPLVRYYDATLREWVVRPLFNKNNESLITVAHQLEALKAEGAVARLEDATQEELLNALKLHLLLTVPHEECVPTALARKDWLLSRLQELWEGGQEASKEERVLRRRVITRYLERLAIAPSEMSLARDSKLVDSARVALGSDDKVGQLLNSLGERFAKNDRDLFKIVGATSTLESRASVHGAFTLDAWRQTTRDVNSVKLWSTSDENWVLGCRANNAEELRAARASASFQVDYLKRYEDNWRQFVQGVSARRPSNATEAETMLSELIGRPGPLGALFQAVKENTELPPAPQAEEPGLSESLVDAAKKATGELGAKVVGAVNRPDKNAQLAAEALDRLKKAFADFAGFGAARADGAETPLDQYRRQLEPVVLALRAYRADESKLPVLATAVSTALESVELLLSRYPSSYGPTLRELLVPPLNGVAGIAQQNRGSQVQALWCETVYRPFQEELAGRFPIQVDSNSPVSLQAFARFFQPGAGLVWKFQSAQLAGSVVQEGERFRFASSEVGEGRKLFREELVQFLNRAAEVKQSFFLGGGAAVRMPFRVRVRGGAGYSVTAFSFGGKTLRYDSGAETWVNLEWPGDAASLGASLAVTPYEGVGPRPLKFEGEWGLFMLLDPRFGHAEALERTDRQFTAGWKPKGSQYWVKIDFATDDLRSPLMSVPFGGAPRSVLPISVPARITHAGGGC